MDKEDIPFSRNQQQWMIWVPLSIAALVLGVYYWQFVKPSWTMDFWQLVKPPLSDDASKWGTFGDYFGGLLNPVISACTLFVAVGVWKFQEKELQDTRAELKSQRNQQRFFDLLNLYHATLDSIHLKGSSDYTGKSAIAYFIRQATLIGEPLSEFLTHDELFSVDPRPTQDESKKYWESDRVSELFAHYFRISILVLAEAKSLLGKEHLRYAELFRAQLSGPELTLLGFHLWFSTESENLTNLAKMYGILKYMPKSPLRTELEKKLDPSVFG